MSISYCYLLNTDMNSENHYPLDEVFVKQCGALSLLLICDGHIKYNNTIVTVCVPHSTQVQVENKHLMQMEDNFNFS